ncbi:unnamed protein product, partial [Nesidiocoris tenuis]
MSHLAGTLSSGKDPTAGPSCLTKPPFPPLCEGSGKINSQSASTQCCPPPDPPCSNCPTCKPPFPPICKSSRSLQSLAESSTSCCPPTEPSCFRCPTCKPPFPPICKQATPQFAPCCPPCCPPPTCRIGCQPMIPLPCPTCKPKFPPMGKTCCPPRRPKPVLCCKPSSHSYPRTPERCPPDGFKSKSHSVNCDQEATRPIPICIDCIPKCKPRFPPACAEKFGCDKMNELRKESPRLAKLWQKLDSSDSKWIRNASSTVTVMYSSARQSLKSAFCTALGVIQNRVCNQCPQNARKPVHYGQIRFNAPKLWARKTSKLNFTGAKPYVESSIPPIRKGSFKKKVRYVKQRVLDGNARRAISVEQEKRKSSGKDPPTLAYSDVLNIVFAQKCSSGVCR